MNNTNNYSELKAYYARSRGEMWLMLILMLMLMAFVQLENKAKANNKSVSI